MLVKATKKYKELNLIDNVLKRAPEEGEVFEVTKERYKELTGGNKFNEIFVEKIEESKEIETADIKVETETAVIRKRKKKNNDI